MILVCKKANIFCNKNNAMKISSLTRYETFYDYCGAELRPLIPLGILFIKACDADVYQAGKESTCTGYNRINKPSKKKIKHVKQY